MPPSDVEAPGMAREPSFSPLISKARSSKSRLPGGTPKPVTVLDTSKHDSHRWPYFLPDGKHFLYLAVSHGSARGSNDAIYFASLDSRESRVLMRGFTNAEYAAGRLLFMRDSALMA